MQRTAVQSPAPARKPAVGRRMQPQPPPKNRTSTDLWYFAYGSNMNPSVLTGRRQVHPKESRPAFLPSHQLTFNCLGFPYSEPGFATIQPMDSAVQQQQQQQQQTQTQQAGDDAWPVAAAPAGCAHGVLHRITPAEWRWVQYTEGVGSSQTGYQVVKVRCYTYDGRPVAALSLQAAPSSLHATARQAAPSARYLKLLTEGAARFSVDPAYQRWLQQLRPYQADDWRAKVGGAASAAVLLGVAAPAMPVYFVGKALGLLPSKQLLQRTMQEQQQQQHDGNASSGDRGGRAPGSAAGEDGAAAEPADLPAAAAALADEAHNVAVAGGLPAFVGWYFNAVSRSAWLVHDLVLSPVLGSGSRP